VVKGYQKRRARRTGREGRGGGGLMLRRQRSKGATMDSKEAWMRESGSRQWPSLIAPGSYPVSVPPYTQTFRHHGEWVRRFRTMSVPHFSYMFRTKVRIFTGLPEVTRSKSYFRAHCGTFFRQSLLGLTLPEGGFHASRIGTAL
jgi:hypothetical protein